MGMKKGRSVFKFVAVKQINEKIRATCDKFRALTSLNKAEYESLFSIFDDLVSERLKHYTLKGVIRVSKSYKESRNSVSAQATTYCLLKILHYEVLRQQGMVLARPSVEDIFEDIF